MPTTQQLRNQYLRRRFSASSFVELVGDFQESPAAALLRRRFPVIDDSDGCGCAFVCRKINKEALAIGGDGVLMLCNARKRAAGNANWEQSRGCSSLEQLAVGRQLHRSGHHFAIQRHVEDFLAVLVPSRLCAAARGNLKLSARPRKWLGVDLKPPGFIRLVRDPFAVGGELALAFLKRGFQESERLLIAGDGKEPQVAARLRVKAAEQQEASIWGKTICHLD